jgi:drug/metabolite transporter (DMT)-like permease
MVATFNAFYFAAKAKVNMGVISALFTCGVAFTTILFFWLYDEKINLASLLGMAMIMMGVLCVAYRPASSEIAEISSTALALAIFFAVCVGLIYTLTSLQCRVFVKRCHITPIQYNIDGMAV